ncbi:hypothetical protein [Streptomyces canus]|uniref:hypothetical protein n=1 Tax=Streptomyces canus TaxID=58343 RepID=UPI0022570FAE|nr:hypothetical protein [Streptomyces canus]MCX4857732.1 hypothetical protein [Streptomyces canus]
MPWDYYPGYADFTNLYAGLVEYAKPRTLAATDNVPITAAGSNALTPNPWVIWSTWGSGMTKTDINTNADVKATYYATNRQNFAWGSIHGH